MLFELLALMRLVRDTMSIPGDFAIVILVGLICFGVPYGYVVGLVIGTALAYLLPNRLSGITPKHELLEFRAPVPHWGGGGSFRTGP